MGLLLRGFRHSKLSQTYLEFNVIQIQNLASQKAEFVNAAVLSGLAVITSVLVVVVFLGVNRDMAKHYQEQAKFSLAKSYFQIVLKQIRSCRNT